MLHPFACLGDEFAIWDDAFDAALAVLTLHHWPDRMRGLKEMSRVAHNWVVVTWEPPQTDFWLTKDYLPHFLEADRALFPPWFRTHPDIADIRVIPIPHDCDDGFFCAYWRRPEAYLDPNIRNAISTFSREANFEAGLGRAPARPRRRQLAAAQPRDIRKDRTRPWLPPCHRRTLYVTSGLEP